jgi:hypothetical protein
MDAPALELWNANAYLESGKYPWTIFAYPESLADDRHLPRDRESMRYLAALLAAGARVGVWHYPANQTVYFACPLEEMEHIRAVVEELEKLGTFPKSFASEHCEQLFRSADKALSN